jgi:hypothetical protein
MNRRTTTKCLMFFGLSLLALPQPVPAQSAAPSSRGIWSYSEGDKLIEVAAKRKQRARLPSCPVNAGATTTCSCPVSGKSAQICMPGEVCSTAGCGG